MHPELIMKLLLLRARDLLGVISLSVCVFPLSKNVKVFQYFWWLRYLYKSFRSDHNCFSPPGFSLGFYESWWPICCRNKVAGSKYLGFVMELQGSKCTVWGEGIMENSAGPLTYRLSYSVVGLPVCLTASLNFSASWVIGWLQLSCLVHKFFHLTSWLIILWPWTSDPKMIQAREMI